MKHKGHPTTTRKNKNGPIVIKAQNKPTGTVARTLINKSGGGVHGVRKPRKKIRASTIHTTERQKLAESKAAEKQDPMSRFRTWDENYILETGKLRAYLSPNSNILFFPHEEFRGKRVAVVKVKEVEISEKNWHDFASLCTKKSKELGRKIAEKVGITWDNWREKCKGRTREEVQTLNLLFGKA